MITSAVVKKSRFINRSNTIAISLEIFKCYHDDLSSAEIIFDDVGRPSERDDRHLIGLVISERIELDSLPPFTINHLEAERFATLIARVIENISAGLIVKSKYFGLGSQFIERTTAAEDAIWDANKLLRDWALGDKWRTDVSSRLPPNSPDALKLAAVTFALSNAILASFPKVSQESLDVFFRKTLEYAASANDYLSAIDEGSLKTISIGLLDIIAQRYPEIRSNRQLYSTVEVAADGITLDLVAGAFNI